MAGAPRLVLVTNDYPPKPGGIQQYLGNLVTRYPGPVRVLAPHDPDAPDDPVVQRSRWGFMLPTPAVTAWVEQEVAEYEPDVVLFGAPHPLPSMGPQLRTRRRVPYGVVCHGAELTVPAAFPGPRQLMAGPLRRADLLFTNSAYTSRVVERIAGRPTTFLGIGVDLEAFHPTRPDPARPRTVIGSVSRFVPRKGQGDVLRAAAELRTRGRDIEVLMVGAGRLEQRLRDLAGKLEVPARFEVAVPWDRLPGLYREMDVFAVPVRDRWMGLEVEGLGVVFLEAAATGLPVIAGASGGSPETVEPGVTGFVVHDRAGLVEALDLLVGDPARARTMGEAGRRRMEDRFTWQAVMERLTDGLRTVVQKPPGTADA